MKISVVINTVNRADSLRRTLDALRWQSHDSFEVIVVNGPSTDPTEQVLEDFAGRIRSVDCTEMNLSKSRNVGISQASGEIVAFIDDDAVPEYDWLAELDRAYTHENVCGAGGIVFDHTGCALQYEYSVSDRVGRTKFDIQPPLDQYSVVGAEPFIYLQGTNMSFRRECLVEIGGFDQEIEYNFDEVEVCVNLIDRGYRISPLAGAAVHHKYLASHVRNARRLFTDPFFAIKNRAYFALSQGRSIYSREEILDTLTEYVDNVRAAARSQRREGQLSAQECDYFLRQLNSGLEIGIDRGTAAQRKSVEIPPVQTDAFLPFPTLSPESPLHVCFVSQEYPPRDFGGIGRFTADLAGGFASQGHEVHVITRSTNNASVDFEDGVWIHRMTVRDHGLTPLTASPLIGNFDHIGSVYEEVASLHERRSLDVVSVPLWAAEGLMCSLDPRFPTITTLMTTMRTVAALHKSWEGSLGVEEALRLEKATVEASCYIHAISAAILDEVRESFDIGRADAQIIPLGVQDVPDAGANSGNGAGDRVEVLFVGRLEFRKGVDILLEAILNLADEFPQAHFTLAGKDTINTELGGSYRTAFSGRVQEKPELAGRVTFAGPVSEGELKRLYSVADLFCAPSRYESFGLVLLEAMRYGVPVIACRAGGMPEIVESGRSGLLAEPGDVDSLTDCLRTLISDEQYRAVLGEGARTRYAEHFTLDTAVANTVEAYSHIARKWSAEQGAPPSTEVARTSVARRLRDTLADVTEMSSVVAGLAAGRLLSTSDERSNPLVVLEDAWELPTGEFIEVAYYTVLDRAPDAPGIALAHKALDGGMSRVMFVRGLAQSHIAVELGMDTSWLPRLMRSAGQSDLERFETIWGLPDDDFIACAYEILLDRQSDEHGRSAWLGHMRSGLSRAEVVRELVTSHEGQACGLDPSWLPEFEAVSPDWEQRSNLQMSRRQRMRLAIVRAPILGHMGRSLKQVAQAIRGLGTLRGTVTELVEEVARGHQTLAELSEKVEHQAGVSEAGASAVDGRIDQVEDQLAEIERQTVVAMTASREQFEASRDQTTAIAGVIDQASQALGDRISRQGFLIDQTTQRIDVLQRKSEALSLDLREQVISQTGDREVQAHIPNEAVYQAKLAEMDGDIRINVGCGEKPLPGYLNIDFRDLPDVDVVADAHALPFDSETLSEIASAHLVEHFRQHQLTTVILPHWHRLLKPGGKLRVTCPNWEAMLGRVQAGEMSLEDFKTLTFGLQDYSGDDHFSMYTPRSLSSLLGEVGFDHVQMLAEERQNGLCPEMELLAARP